MTMTAPPAPPLTPERIAAQRELLAEYIQYRKLFAGPTRYEILTHEYKSRRDEDVRVTVHVRTWPDSSNYPGDPRDITFEFQLEELKMYQQRKPLGSMNDSTATPATAARPAVVEPQLDWTFARTNTLGRAAELQREATRMVSRQISDGAHRMECRCSTARLEDYLCDHLKFMYSTGWEREKLYDEGGVGSKRNVLLPIGMGRIGVKFEAHILENGLSAPMAERRTGYLKITDPPNTQGILNRLARITSPFPDDVNSIILAPGEGSIKLIRYIEDLLRSTDEFGRLSKMIPANGDALAMMDSVCSRVHRGTGGRTLLSHFMVGLKHDNANRENWILACTYALVMDGLCLPCFEATTGSAAIPNF